jgi:opacity protein-like surface antigen
MEIMMIKRNTLPVLLGLALAGISSTAMAEQTTGWYFGLTGGEAKADLDQDDLDSMVTDAFLSTGSSIVSADSSLEDSDNSFSVFAGYRFFPALAVEAGYVDFGTAEYRAAGIVNPPGPVSALPVSFAADYEVTGFTVAAIGALPLGENFDLHARAGILFAKTENSVAASSMGSSASDSVSADSQDLHYGVGAGYHLGTHWSFTLDWVQFKDVGDEEETGEGDLERLSLGVTYRL